MTMSHHHDASAVVINPGKAAFPTGRGESESSQTQAVNGVRARLAL